MNVPGITPLSASLGHADLNSVTRSYVSSETDSALREMDDTMFDREMRFRRKSKEPPPSSPPWSKQRR